MMKKDLLLPHGFKTVGWFLLLPTLLLGIVTLCNGTDTGWLAEMIENAIGRQPAPAVGSFRSIGNGIEPWLNNILIIGIIGGCILVTCSREQIEDEMIGRIRLNALLVSLYANFSVVIVATLCVYGFDFLDVLVYNLFTLPLLFLIIYKTMLLRLKRSLRDEE